MMVKETLGEAKTLALEILRNGWAPAIALMSFVFWFGGMVTSRMESPEQKMLRIDRVVDPIEFDLQMLEKKIELHVETAGHTVMEERVNFLQGQVNDLLLEARRMERDFTSEFVRKDELDILIRGD